MASLSPFLLQIQRSGGAKEHSEDEKPRCRNCVFFVAREGASSSRKSNIYGDCRRNPPSTHGERFPSVERTEFCGEWQSGKFAITEEE